MNLEAERRASSAKPVKGSVHSSLRARRAWMKRCMSTSATGEKSTGQSACDWGVTRSATHSITPPAWPAFEKCNGRSQPYPVAPPAFAGQDHVSGDNLGTEFELAHLQRRQGGEGEGENRERERDELHRRYSSGGGMKRPPPQRCVRPMPPRDRRHIRGSGAILRAWLRSPIPTPRTWTRAAPITSR